MDINKPFTLEDFEKLAEKLVAPKPKDIQINRKMYELICTKLGCEPSNVVINEFLPNNQAICYDSDLNPFKYTFTSFENLDG